VFQVLTKRADRLRRLTHALPREHVEATHVWLGVSVEDRKYGVPRIDQLRQARAAIRFLSIEPLLEDLGMLDLTGIDWVIVGGESGPGARAMRPEWVTSIRDQCTDAKVPFFFKQWGGVRKGTTGRELDGRTYDAVPRRPQGQLVPIRAERARRGAALAELVASTASTSIPEPRLRRAI
jgi:protein gp37